MPVLCVDRCVMSPIVWNAQLIWTLAFASWCLPCANARYAICLMQSLQEFQTLFDQIGSLAPAEKRYLSSRELDDAPQRNYLEGMFNNLDGLNWRIQTLQPRPEGVRTSDQFGDEEWENCLVRQCQSFLQKEYARKP